MLDTDVLDLVQTSCGVWSAGPVCESCISVSHLTYDELEERAAYEGMYEMHI